MGRVYVSFDQLSFVVSADDYVVVGDLLKEVARRTRTDWAKLEAVWVDEGGGQAVSLSREALVAKCVQSGKADILVREQKGPGAEALKAEGNALMADGRFEEAERKYKEALERTGEAELERALRLNLSLALV